MKQRNEFIDVLKAIAIILVVFGHCIQYGSGLNFLSSGAFFDNKVFIFIYSFHMPLFMLISGYLFGFSIKKNIDLKDSKELILKKFKQIVIPLFFWSLISFGIIIAKCLMQENSSDYTLFWLIKKFVSCFINGPWFLWAIWWCSLAIITVRLFFKDNILIYFLALAFTLVIPDNYGLALYKFMYPYFLLGYWFNNHNLEVNLKKVYLNRWFVGGGNSFIWNNALLLQP